MKRLFLLLALACAGCDSPSRYRCELSEDKLHHFGQWQSEGHDYRQVRFCTNCNYAEIISNKFVD